MLPTYVSCLMNHIHGRDEVERSRKCSFLFPMQMQSFKVLSQAIETVPHTKAQSVANCSFLSQNQSKIKEILKRSHYKQQQKDHPSKMTFFNIQNSVALVTGTNKPNGIGQAIVEALLAQGADKVYATARDTDQLADLVAKHDGKVVAVSLDVTDLAAIAELPEKYPDVTLLVNNAGYLSGKSSIGDIELARKEIEVNYIAPLALVKNFAPVFEKMDAASEDSKPTAVVNVASIASLVNFTVAGTYSASKAALHSLTAAQRRDLKNSLVVGLYPGPIDTEMAREMPFEKTPPSAVAQSVVEALKTGTEDVFPDPMAVHVYEGWKADAKAMELAQGALA